MTPRLHVQDFAVTAPGGGLARLPELVLAAGQAVALLGPSGCGKSTLLAAMLGVLSRPGWTATGRVRWHGQELGTFAPAALRQWRWRDVAFLPQDAFAALDPLVAVGRQVVEATGRPFGDVVAMLTRLGVADAAAVAARPPHTLSGGQAQRVLLAIAFLRAPALVVADEPTASLDGGSTAEAVAHLRALQAKGSALLVATHELDLVRELGCAVLAHRGGAFVPAGGAGQPWPQRPAAAPADGIVLAARDLGHAHGGRVVLDRLDLQLARGEVVAIVGPSGAGKTTLLRLLAGHWPPQHGAVQRPSRRSAVQYVGQDANASLTPGTPLRRLLAEAHAPGFDMAAAAAALALPAGVLAAPRERMSGGERRRAALLRALAVAPEVLLLDEPTASLDHAAAEATLAVVLAAQRERGVAVILVTHDRALARSCAHRVLALEGGRLCPAM